MSQLGKMTKISEANLLLMRKLTHHILLYKNYMYDLIKCMAIKLATPGNFYDDSRKGCGMDKFRKLRKDYDDDHPPNLDD
jgi:hypothetical protein